MITDENAVLEATAHSALAQILRELDDDGAAEDQNNLAILLLAKADNIVARTYQIPIKLELADLQLDRGDTKAPGYRSGCEEGALHRLMILCCS